MLAEFPKSILFSPLYAYVSIVMSFVTYVVSTSGHHCSLPASRRVCDVSPWHRKHKVTAGTQRWNTRTFESATISGKIKLSRWIFVIPNPRMEKTRWYRCPPIIPEISSKCALLTPFYFQASEFFICTHGECKSTATQMPGLISSAEQHLFCSTATLDNSFLFPLPIAWKYFEVKATCFMKYLRRC